MQTVIQSIESNVSNFNVNRVFNRKPAKLLKKRVRIELVGVKHDTCEKQKVI